MKLLNKFFTVAFLAASGCMLNAQAPANNCSGAATLTINGACGSGTLTNNNTSGPTYSCGTSGAINRQGYYTFTTTSAATVTITAESGNRNLALQVFTGGCGSTTQIACANADNTNNSSQTETITFSAAASTTYIIRVLNVGGNNNMALNSICVTTPVPAPANDNCAGAINLTPGASCSYTAGTTLNATASGQPTVCGSNPDDDVWYRFTANGPQHQVNVDGATNFNAIVQVYSGTCGSLTSLQCVNATGQDGTETVNLTGLTSGATYYVRVFHNAAGSSSSPTFNICVVNGNPCSLGTGVTNVASLPYSVSGQTTCGQGNDLTPAGVTDYCGTSSYYNGEDAVYIFTPSASGTITVNLTSSGSYTGLMVHEGCPVNGGACVVSAQDASGSKSVVFCATAGTTYYVIIDSWPSPACNPYNLSISAPAAITSPNDLPCNAVALTLGVAATGDNSCTDGSGEPAVPACWSSGVVNSVWYSVVCPASGTLNIKTGAGSLHDMQIAVYSGSCSALTYVSCNDNASACTGSSELSSELNLTGLIPGATYYIVVDGESSEMGDFSIVAVDGSSPYPNVTGQDCAAPNPVCNSSFSVSDPGYGGYGFNCDFSDTYCLASSERSVVWYSIPINAAGTLQFDIVPNDFDCSAEDETDYDYAIWKVTGSGAVSCTDIFAGTGLPSACNYDSYGVTGLAGTGNAPASLSATVCPQCSGCASYSPAGSYDSAYEPMLTVAAGEVYFLAVSNFSNSTSGFHIDFRSSPIGYVGSTATSVTWTGGDATQPTLWTDADNWGGCNSPNCTRDAIVAPFTNQPSIASGTTMYAKDVTIQAGATLTMQSNSTLELCGSFTNYGTLVMDPGSTIRFVGGAAQNLSGSLTGSNSLGNVVVDKTGGQVNLNNDLTMTGSFQTVSNTSIFNTNGRYIRVQRNFTNANGNSTFTGTGTTGTLEFTGTAAQNYNGGASQLDLNFVIMNKASNALTLLSNMFIKSATGTLTLTSGQIITSAYRVDVANTAPAAVTAGNTASFVNGNLYRAIRPSGGSYDLPVGNTVKGYQLANINFTGATTIPQLQARFDGWSATPPTQGGAECSTTYNLPSEDNGYWTINASANPTSGTYSCTLYPQGAMNTTPAASWGVMKSTNGGATWVLNGSCAASTATVVNRTGMNGFSLFGISQGTTPLPIELISFSGHVEGEKNKLEWVTASEQNNDHFTVERSLDGNVFEEAGRLPGAGSSNEMLEYSLYDEYPYHPLTYYRLKQTDFNGDFSYSALVPVYNTVNSAVALQSVYPNPSDDLFNLVLSSIGDNTIEVTVTDVYGKLLRNFNVTLYDGVQTVQLDGSAWTSGVYLVHVSSGNRSLNTIQKIVRK